ncbi:hypothetical protein I6F15_15220 [Bradyrhizobium sp. BRP14]|nr:hypothetical protein [Bradyrhizobium sp. BRP14]
MGVQPARKALRWRLTSPRKSKSRRMVVTGAITILLIGLSQTARSADVDRDTLRLLIWQAPSTLNPHLAPGIKDQTASRIVYEPLASFDDEGNLVPFLAAEIPSVANGQVAADGRSVTWKLRPNVKWSDGVPFTAKDVLFTHAYITNKDIGSSSTGSYRSVEKVEALDDLTVKVTFKTVNPAWSLPFVGVQGMIIPEHVFAAYNNKDAVYAPANLAPIDTVGSSVPGPD